MRLDPDADMQTRGGYGGSVAIASPAPDASHGPRRPRTVIVLLVVFTYGMDKAVQDVQAINRALGKIKRRPVMHGDRQVAWVMETHFTAAQIMDLTRATLSRDCVASAWAFTPADVASVMPIDPFSDRVLEAWSSVRDWNRTTPRLSPEAFTSTRGMPDGRGEVITRILDDHPLVDRRPAP